MRCTTRSRLRTSAVANVLLAPVEGMLHRLDATIGGHIGLPGGGAPRAQRLDARPARPSSTAGLPTSSGARPSSLPSRMATFTTQFLGCKVSFADAQAIRERLLADGHEEVPEGGEIAVVNTCCVTHEAVSKSRQAASRAARAARTVYVTGCASNLDGALDAVAPNIVVVGRTGEEAATFVAGDVGAIGCVQARSPARACARVREDPRRLLVLVRFCVIPLVRGATRSRTRRRGAGRGPATCSPGPSGGRVDGCQPRVLP